MLGVGLLSVACGQAQDLGSTESNAYPVTPGVLCTGQTDITDFKVDDRYVYCLSYGCVLAVDKRASTAFPDVERTTHCTGGTAVGVAGDGSRVYVTGVAGPSPYDRGYIYTSPISETQTSLVPMFASTTDDDGLAAFHYAADIVVDESRVYWTTERGVYAGPKIAPADAADFELLADVEVLDPNVPPIRIGLVQDAKNLYWARNTDVMMVPKTGGEAVPLAVGPSQITSLSIRSGWVYFAAGTVRRVSLSTREIQGFSVGPGWFNGVAADEHYVYASGSYANANASCSREQVTGYVVRVPLGGGEAEVVAEDQPCPSQVAVDESAVYWRTENPGERAEVHRIPKSP